MKRCPVDRFRLERLEPRRMMAGDLTVQVAGGVLEVLGDSAGNAVAISQAAPGEFRVQGLFHDGAPTTINNLSSFLRVSGVNEVLVSTGAGADRVVMEGMTLANPPTTLSGSLIVETGLGDDVIDVRNISVAGSVFLSNSSSMIAGGDDDQISLLDAAVGSLWITTTAYGRDAVTIAKATVQNTLTIETSAGSWAPAPWIDADQVRLYGVRANQLFITTGWDQDRVRLEYVTAMGGLDISTGDGNDQVSVEYTKTTGTAAISTGSGNDHVLIRRAAADQMFAWLGDGEKDLLEVFDSSAGYAEFNGGPGTSDKIRLAGNQFGAINLFGFP